MKAQNKTRLLHLFTWIFKGQLILKFTFPTFAEPTLSVSKIQIYQSRSAFIKIDW